MIFSRNKNQSKITKPKVLYDYFVRTIIEVIFVVFYQGNIPFALSEMSSKKFHISFLKNKNLEGTNYCQEVKKF